MTLNEIIDIVKKQLMIDFNCKESDFEAGKITITDLKEDKDAIKYCDVESAMKGVCFGGAAVFSVGPTLVADFNRLLGGKDPAWIFDPQSLIKFSEILYLHGHNLGNMIQYYIPNPDAPKTEPICEIRKIEKADALKYMPEAASTLDFKAIAAIKDGKIVGIAGASKKANKMWEIGIEVNEEYRGQGIAVNLVGLLKDEILAMNEVPYYGTASSHTISMSVGVNAGFMPCFTRLYSRPRDDEFLHIHSTDPV